MPDNYGEFEERDFEEWGSYERDRVFEERDHQAEVEVDRLRRDDPVKAKKKAAERRAA